MLSLFISIVFNYHDNIRFDILNITYLLLDNSFCQKTISIDPQINNSTFNFMLILHLRYVKMFVKDVVRDEIKIEILTKLLFIIEV